jgi:predicted LPLAT superfamily acyltransferase
MSGRWLEQREVGALWGVRILVVLATMFGRRVPRLVLPLIAAYYVILHRSARAASSSYLARIGQPSGLWAVYLHVLRFAQCTLDRLFFIKGDYRPFRVTRTGKELLDRLAHERRGAILLGAHLGSFEALRAAAVAEAIPINVFGNFRNAPMVNSLLDELGNNSQTRFVDAGNSPVVTALSLRKLVERGEIVAILADRAGHGATAAVPFLGASARLPTGPYALAAVLGCPVYLTFALHRPPASYELHCELFAERIEAPRATRNVALSTWAARYAARLEYYCRLAPDNWFNFYDFWEQDDVHQAAG